MSISHTLDIGQEYGYFEAESQYLNGTDSANQPITTEDVKRKSFFGSIWPTEGHTYFCTFGKGSFVSWNVQDISTFVKRHTSQDLYFGIGQTNKAGTSGQRASRSGNGRPHVTSIACLFGDFDGQDFDSEISKVKALYKAEDKAAKAEKRRSDYTKLPTINPTKGKAGAWKALQEAESKVGAATFVIDSGGGYQAYWLLDQPIIIRQKLDAEDIRAFFAQWQAFIGADKSAKDLERVYRVPYSYNCKSHYSGGPLLASIVRADPSARYNISDIRGIVCKPRQMELAEQKSKPAKQKVIGKVKVVEPPKAEKTSADHERDIRLAAGYFKRYSQARCDNYSDWFNAACALKHRFAGTDQEDAAFKLWDEWSKKSKSYDSTDANQKKWETITPTTNPRNFGSLAYWANEDDPNPTPPSVLESLLETVEGIPNRDDLTDKLPDFLDDGLKLSTKELTLFCRALAKRNVKKGDIGQFRADLKAIRKEKGKLQKGDQIISGRVVRQGHEIMSELFELGYDFRMNKLDDSIEVNHERLTDGMMAEIEIRMDDLGFTSGAKVERTYTAYAYQNSYHPIKEYLEALKWDGIDHIKFLADHLEGSIPEQAERLFYRDMLNNELFDNDDGYSYTWTHAALRRWLAGSVAKVYGKSQNTMIVLDGPQGIGKSYLSQWLASPMKDYFLESAINTEDKDSLIRLAKNWIWEVAELGATTRKSDREALKSLLTLDKVVARKAYARTDMRKPALASFFGTINNEAGFLGDPTGNRRFTVVPVTSIDHGYSKLLDPNRIWAQAVALFHSGETGNLTKHEKAIQTAVNRAYTTKTATSDILDDLYMVTHDPNDKAPVTEVRKVLHADGYRGNSSQAKREIDRWMTLNNIKKGGRGTRFYGRKKACYVGIKFGGYRCEECGDPDILQPLTLLSGVLICFKCRT